MPPWQSHQNSSGARFDERADFKDLEPNLTHGGPRQGRALKHSTQRREQNERKGVQEEPEAVGRELVATPSARKQVQPELLDAVLAVAPLAVALVERLRLAFQVGDHEAWIVALFH